jgi:ElaB/YqjD/DUF883 family membrane-anchored ribosome-binding protein
MGERTDHINDYDYDLAAVEPLHSETAGFTQGNMTTASDVGSGNLGDVDLDRELDADTGTNTDTNPGNEDDPDQIRDEIADTRTQMSQTIDEIQERLRPQRLVEQAKDTVREATIGRAEHMVSDATDTARSAGQSFLTTIRENPLPAALAGIGLGWLIYKSRENMPNNRPRYNDYRSYSYGPRYDEQAYRARYRSDEENGPSVKDRVQNTAGQVTDQAQQLASQAGDKVQQAASQVQDTASQVADQAQYQVQRAQGWLERSWDENPLAVGALALAAGAVIGFSLPETEPENRLMGSARDDLMQKAQATAQDTVQKVQAVAQQATDAAKDAAQHEAQNQGLTQQNPA